MIWNEPNNKSHWDFELDPEWTRLRRDGEACRRRRSRREPGTAARARRHFADRSALHPQHRGARACWTTSTWWRCTASRSTGTTGRSTNGRTSSRRSSAVTDLPIWVSEVGVSTFGAEEVQEFGLRAHGRAADRAGAAHPLVQPLRSARAPGRRRPGTARRRDRPITAISTWACCARTARPSWRCETFAEYTPDLGICQWFHFEDHRLDDAVRWMRASGCATCAPA